jgi:hypothetical protein
LIDHLILNNRDHVIFGDAGTGKTLLMLYAARCLINGGAVADVPSVEPRKGKILYIGSDSGTANESQLEDYLERMGLLDDDNFAEQFIYRSADEEAGIAQWNLNTHNLVWLKQLLETEDVQLVIIDSLKSICSNTRYSIDDRSISDAMRLLQNIVLPHSALVYIHHSNKSTTRSSHRAGGSTDIVETVSGVIEMVKEVPDDHGGTPEYWCKVHKLRGESYRAFQVDFTWEDGIVSRDEYTVEDTIKALQSKKTDLPLKILLWAYDKPGKRFSSASFEKEHPDAPHRSNFGRACQQLIDQCLIEDTFNIKRGTYRLLQDGVDVVKAHRAKESTEF